MQQEFEDKLLSSLKTSFITKSNVSTPFYLPQLLVNDYRQEKKILSSLKEELETCNAFDFSVAFINNEGLASIKLELNELADYKIPGRILTTNYLNFTSPSALQELLEFPNIEVRVYTKGGFHPKGYIFKHDNYESIIIGSANLTASALSLNQEWSLKFLSCVDGQIVFTVREEFEKIWNDAEIINAKWIDKYKEIYELKRIKLQAINSEISQKEKDVYGNIDSEEELEIIPNKMQQEAMVALDNLRANGENRALLIAATGTGKTYLSIFDINQLKPKKVLYVAHRDMILNKSERSFKTIFPTKTTGFLTGYSKDKDVDVLFASVFTLAKDDVLKSFKPDNFDYIIVDEVHHAGAQSYTKIIEYFKPKFLLGLTATPERTDGFDIFKLFHNNIPYEIRLQKAMEEDLLCPFHYYGISDLTINGELVDDNTNFTKLVSDERIRHIEKAIKLYRNYSYPVKGLIFCSRIEEAKELSQKLNEKGFCTTYLTGSNSDIERELTIQKLESDSDPLQYIISVDIFNEGVDIPSVNQVVMLRPTKSAIIFVQQLGRGLRKAKEKTYVSVIDFIGNYSNNFFIPIALYGDNSYNKDNLRKALTSGSSCIPGTSTVQINSIARQKIFDSISKTNFSTLKILEKEYEKLKIRLAKIPSMMDFVENGFIDPLLFVNYSGSYYEFKEKIKEASNDLPSDCRKSLQFVSLEFAHGIRVHEILILRLLIEMDSIPITQFSDEIAKYKIKLNKKDLNGMKNTLSSIFYTNSDKKKYGDINYISFENDIIKKSTEFTTLLKNPIYKAELIDCLNYGLNRVKIKLDEKLDIYNLILYRKYSRKDICKLLNWKSDCSSTIYGYKTETSLEDYTCPIFVNYKKEDNISESTKYEDKFIDSSLFNWMSRSDRTSSSREVAEIINQKNNDIKVMLFVKKDNAEGTDFYYMGRMKCKSFEDTKMKSGNNVVNIRFDMENAVPQNLYSYLES